MGSLSLLFPTQESNHGLLHCRLILYKVSYQGSPYTYLSPFCLYERQHTIYTVLLTVTSVMSDSVRPHRRQLPCPGSPVPGILQARTLEWVAIYFSNAWKWSRSAMSDPQRPHGLQSTRVLRPWDFPDKSTGVGCHCLLWITVLYPVFSWSVSSVSWQ